MAEKAGVELTLKRVVSIPKKKLNVPKAPLKAKSLTVSILAKEPVLFYSHIILSDELRAAIDEKWNNCWPVNTLKPLVLLDLISYLLFIKKLEENHLIAGSSTQIFTGNLTPANEPGWSSLKDMNAKNLHNLFTNEEAIPELIKNYGLTNLQYSLFLKEPLLLAPTARLLFNMVEIIKIMDAEGSDTKAAIFEYLLNKAEIEAQNEQVFPMDKVIKLIVELMQPTPKDLIWDPSAGNAGFLVNAAMYSGIKNSKSNNFNNDFFGDNFKGVECDPIWLRIGAMNMIIHGIEDPKLGGINAFRNANPSSCEQPTLILSNLFFEGIRDKKATGEQTSLTETGKPEIHFLNLILKTLKKGGRGAVIVPEYILYNNASEIKTIRQQIIDDHKLAAVISLSGKGGSLFSPGILIFSELKSGINDKVWFYKMKPGIKKNEADSTGLGEIGVPQSMEEYDEMTKIINQWKNDTEENTRIRTANSFYVHIDEIKANNYNLCFNEYKKIEKEPQLYTPDKIPIIDKGIINHNSTGKKVRFDFAKIKLPSRLQDLATFQKLSNLNMASSHMRRISSNFVSLIIIIYLVVMAFNFIFLKNKIEKHTTASTKNNISRGRNKPNEAIAKPVTGTAAPAKLSQEQIKAIIYDTTHINHFDEQPGGLSNSLEDSVNDFLTDEKADDLISKSSNKKHKTETFENTLSGKYIVIDKTFFHNQPYEGPGKKTYLDPLNNDILNPIHDKNGFIYVVNTNQLGHTSKGWINKKDLMLLR